ncbi:MAG TPA: flagellar export chaperone FliS [Alphaproteobacteria bacterium]|nr:flagellar export chaperone FliS [Alphaproteobacteria bacterium]
MNNRGAAAYQVQQVMTASPLKLVAMLYDKAIHSLKEAIRAIEAGDIQGRWNGYHRAFEIITHLRMTLDRKRGGEVAANLDQLYGFMLVRLHQINTRNDPAPAREVIALLEPLRDSWHQAAAQRATAAPAPAAPSADPRAALRTIVSA